MLHASGRCCVQTPLMHSDVDRAAAAYAQRQRQALLHSLSANYRSAYHASRFGASMFENLQGSAQQGSADA